MDPARLFAGLCVVCLLLVAIIQTTRRDGRVVDIVPASYDACPAPVSPARDLRRWLYSGLYTNATTVFGGDVVGVWASSVRGTESFQIEYVDEWLPWKRVFGVSVAPACTAIPLAPCPVSGCIWPLSATFTVDPSWPSGVYSVRIVHPIDLAEFNCSYSGDAGYTQFVVGPSRTRGIDKKPLVLLDTHTAQAYSIGGSGVGWYASEHPRKRGFMFARPPHDTPCEDLIIAKRDGMCASLSYARPYRNCDGMYGAFVTENLECNGQAHTQRAEGWATRNVRVRLNWVFGARNVDYCSVDAFERCLNMNTHSVVSLVGKHEYVTEASMRALRRYASRGGHVLVFAYEFAFDVIRTFVGEDGFIKQIHSSPVVGTVAGFEEWRAQHPTERFPDGGYFTGMSNYHTHIYYQSTDTPRLFWEYQLVQKNPHWAVCRVPWCGSAVPASMVSDRSFSRMLPIRNTTPNVTIIAASKCADDGECARFGFAEAAIGRGFAYEEPGDFSNDPNRIAWVTAKAMAFAASRDPCARGDVDGCVISLPKVISLFAACIYALCFYCVVSKKKCCCRRRRKNAPNAPKISDDDDLEH